MRRPRGLAITIAVVIAAVLAAWIGGGKRGWDGGRGGVLLASLKSMFSTTSTSSILRWHHQTSFSTPPHCSLLPASRQLEFVLAAQRVVLPDGIHPAASESRD